MGDTVTDRTERTPLLQGSPNSPLAHRCWHCQWCSQAASSPGPPRAGPNSPGEAGGSPGAAAAPARRGPLARRTTYYWQSIPLGFLYLFGIAMVGARNNCAGSSTGTLRVLNYANSACLRNWTYIDISVNVLSMIYTFALSQEVDRVLGISTVIWVCAMVPFAALCGINFLAAFFVGNMEYLELPYNIAAFVAVGSLWKFQPSDRVRHLQGHPTFLGVHPTRSSKVFALLLYC
jgi:hypothetical protein